MDFLKSTGFKTELKHSYPCDVSELKVYTDFEVPKDPQVFKNLGDLKSFFKPSMKVKISNNIWQNPNGNEKLKILIFMARSKTGFKISNNVADDTTEISTGDIDRSWETVNSFNEFLDLAMQFEYINIPKEYCEEND